VPTGPSRGIVRAPTPSSSGWTVSMLRNDSLDPPPRPPIESWCASPLQAWDTRPVIPKPDVPPPYKEVIPKPGVLQPGEGSGADLVQHCQACTLRSNARPGRTSAGSWTQSGESFGCGASL